MRNILTTAVLVTAILAFAPILEVDIHKLSASASQARPDAGSPSEQSGTSAAIKIGLVDNSKNQYLDGCGCSFWPVNKAPKSDDRSTWKYLLVGNYDEQAWMNINGRIIQLRLTNNTIRYKGKKGERYQQTYQSGEITANVECIATGFGDTHSVDCNATITVVKDDQKQVVTAIGSCGC
jgi:hypothetical protein